MRHAIAICFKFELPKLDTSDLAYMGQLISSIVQCRNKQKIPSDNLRDMSRPRKIFQFAPAFVYKVAPLPVLFPQIVYKNQVAGPATYQHSIIWPKKSRAVPSLTGKSIQPSKEAGS